MRRLVMGLLVGALLGFAGCWLAFGADLGGDVPTGPTQADVEVQVAKRSGTGYASCNQRQYPPNRWDCSTSTQSRVGSGACLHAWLATVDTSGTISVRDEGATTT